MADTRGFFAKLWDGITKKNCPKCDKHGGEGTGTTTVESTDAFETVEQEEKHYDAEGKYTGSTKRPVQVMMRTVIYDQHYKCDYCSHQWSERKSSKNRL